MITGYNTDVRHGEVVFHVQTEDKGAGNPFIESLVYVGGQVLATKRATYADLLAGGKDEKEIVALMDHQHRTMIAAIRHGKFDAKLAELAGGRLAAAAAAAVGERPRSGVQTGSSRAVPIVPPTSSGSMPAMPAHSIPAPAARVIRAPTPAAPALGAPAPAAPAPTAPPAPPAPLASPAAPHPARPAPVTPATPFPSAARAAPAPPAAPAAAGPAPNAERTLDQVILEYLTNEADQEQLVLLLDGDAELALGRRAALALRTTSSKSGLPVAGAQVSIRMISTIAEPRILAHGATNERGALPLAFDIPALDRGTAALIITAISAIGRAELKHLL